MSAWTEDGIVAELQYGHACYVEALPAHISFALALRGWRPSVEVGQPFCWAELGAGQALTSNVVAALFPMADVWAMDLLPAHMDNALHLSRSAGLDNTHFCSQSFARFLQDGGPAFDVIIVHGVWSWVSEDNRRLLTQLIDQRLKPGGTLFVSYNCLPGWAAHMPVRRLLADHVRAGQGTLPERLTHALSFASQLSDIGGYFDRIPDAVNHLGRLIDRDPAYLAHEYLNRDWMPFYHADLVERLAPVGLRFCASATLADHLDHWRLGASSRRLLQTIDDPVLYETAKDTLADLRFRRDLFVKAPTAMAADDRQSVLAQFRFCLTVPRHHVPETVDTPSGRLMLGDGGFAAVADRLSAGPAGLLDLAGDGGWDGALRSVLTLTALGVAAVTYDQDPAAIKRCQALNGAMGAISAITQAIDCNRGCVINAR